MQKTTTLINLRKFFGKFLTLTFVFAIFAVYVNGQSQYVNGNLGTGTLSKSGVAAPAGTQWHEMQNNTGNTTQTNVSIAFDCSPILGSSRVADNFTVPSTQQWNISKMTFYAVVLAPPPATSPITAVRVVIRDASPVGASNVIFGDLTTNRLSATSFSNVYAIPNSQVPAPGTVPNTNFVVWKVEADINTTLSPGNYWVEYQMLGGAGQRVFALMSQPVGARTAAGYNGVNTFNGNPWASTFDNSNTGAAPVNVDYCFGVTYNATPCNAPTASVLSQVTYPTAPVSLINETFTTAIPLPAGWVQQNNSTPAGATAWFQGNTGVFPGNTPPGYIAANFNNVTGANTISNWLFAPNITLKNGDSLTFFTRSIAAGFPDRMQVRRSQNGASTNVGATNTSVGDFTDLLLDINPTYTTTGYPGAWTKFTLIMSGLPAGGISGRIAFRYFVENGGPAGANSDYIGLDDVLYRTPGNNLPPTTCVGSAANLKVDITGGNSPYTVVITPTAPPGAPITVTNYISGTSIPVTPAVTTQYSLTSVTGCGVGTGNSGTPTVVVSPTPFPPLVIEALPDAPICAGDPTLLTVKTGVIPSPTTLYNQTAARINGVPSQNFSDFPTFSSQSADDFTVPVGANWSVTRVTAGGLGAGVPTSVNVVFYANSGTNLPGAVVATRNNITTFTNAAGNYTVDLPTAVNLAPGTYWVSIVVNMAFGTGGQWFWGNFGAPNIGSEYAFQNPGGGFGTPCTAWGYGGTSCNVGGGATNRNLIFSIVGINAANSPLPAGYTFQWTPAAGLSNPTANPVGASPMVTTTYSVLVTAPGGCQGTATKTVVVNQPPAITTNPVDAIVCANGSTSFGIVATGAAPLAYQWEVQIGGVGAWSPISNGTPYGGATTATLTINPVSGTLNGNRYRCVVTGLCNPNTTSNSAKLTVNPLPVIPITPVGPVCGGVAGISGTALTVGSAAPPVPGSVTVNSGAISVAIPDNTPTGATSNLTVSGIPANATITGISVKNTMPHTFIGDMVFALKVPNGDVLNLDYYLSGTFGGVTTGFLNTVISSTGTAALSTGTNPYTGVFRADGQVAATANGPAAPTGFTVNRASYAALIANMTAANANGTYTLAMYDGGPADLGTLTNWTITIDYTTPGTGTGATLSYVWSPAAGLYTDAGANTPYTGQNLQTVYAAPTQFTVYTVTATNTTTGCVNTNKVAVNYTPPAPAVTPNPVAMCLGDAAVKLKSSSVTSTNVAFNSGTISVPIPEGNFPTRPATAATNTIAVSGIPANAVITKVAVKMNATHAYANDIVAVLKAPGGGVINLDAIGGYQNNAGANYLNTVFSSTGTVSIATGAAPFTGTWQADRAGVTFTAFGFNLSGGPVGFDPTTTSWATYMGGIATNGNGNWTLAAYDAGAPDVGTLTNWELQLTYAVGVPATAAVWSPITGLFSDANATVPYIAGTAVDSVWAKPTTIGPNTYNVTVNSVPVPDPSNPAAITIPSVGTGTPYPSAINVFGFPTTGVAVKSVTLNGLSHTWSNDIDILLQSPTGQNVILMSDVGGANAITNVNYTFDDAATATMSGTAANASGTYKPTNFADGSGADNWPAPGPGAFVQATPTLALFGNTANVNGDWLLLVVDDVAGDQGTISGGWSIKFNPNIPACTSPERTVVVTVNQPISITTQPTNKSVCTDKTTTFSVVATGTTPTYQWQVSTNAGSTWTSLTNAAPYSGVTTATLTITSPSVTLNNSLYRCVISGAAPCATVNSNNVLLTVNPLPTIVISANPYTKLFPGLTTVLSSTSTPAAATYIWKKNGGVVGGNTSTINVDVDGMGDYTLTVTDVNGCTNTSNTLTIADSASGKVFIYPNPNGGVFQVRYYSANNTRAPRGLNVYDAKGSRVYIGNYSNTAAYSRMDVDLRKHGKGIYWVEVVDGNGDRLAVGRAVVL